jgi:hypothetical protein
MSDRSLVRRVAMLVAAEGCAGAARSRQLEAEMMAFSREWDRAVDGSPNRLDAAV